MLNIDAFDFEVIHEEQNYKSPKSDRISEVGTSLSVIPMFNVAPGTPADFGLLDFFLLEWPRKNPSSIPMHFFQLTSKLNVFKVTPAMRLTLNTKGFFLSSAAQRPFTFN